MKVAIVGGGISGLTTAFYLKKFNPNFDVTIFEEEETLGGKMDTKELDGFKFETGSNGFLSNKPDTLELVELAGANHLLLKSNDLARVRFIYRDKLYQLPNSPKEFLTTPILTFKDKLRVFGEFFVKPKMDSSDESLQSFGYRRVGVGFTDNFLDVMSAGIFASTPTKLSLNSAFPIMVELEQKYGGLFKGMIKRKRGGNPSGVLMSFKNGVKSFIDHLEKVIDAKIFKNEKVITLSKNEEKYIVQTIKNSYEFDIVILGTPSHESSVILSKLDKDLSEELAKIKYSKIAIVGFGYKNLSHTLEGFGLLTTTSAKEKILGVLWDSSIFPDRAKDGKSIRVLIGGERNRELLEKSDAKLIEIAKDGLKKTMGVDTKPDTTFFKRWDFAIPSYEVGHIEVRNAIFEKLKSHKNLYLNSNAYFGIGLNDCVKNSKELAIQISKR